MVTGVFFIVASLAAVAGLLLYGPVLKAGYIAGAGADTRVFLGAFAEVILAIACIGTAVTLFSIVKRQHEGVALGYVAARTVEAVVIVVGIISVLSVVTLRQDLAGAAGASALGQSLIAVHDWTFLFGPGFATGAGTLLVAYLMYTSRLVPRTIAVLGLIGGPLIFASGIMVLLGVYEQLSAVGTIAAIPVAAWEMILAVYLIVKGFRAPALQELGFTPVVPVSTSAPGAVPRTELPQAA